MSLYSFNKMKSANLVSSYIHSYSICPSSFFSDCPFKVQNMRFNVCLTICMLITIYEYLLFCMLKLLVSKSADLVLDARLSPPRCEAKERDCLTETRTNTIGWVDFKIFQELRKKLSGATVDFLRSSVKLNLTTPLQQ